MMDTMTGLIVAAAVLAVAGLFGLWRRRNDGRMRDVPTPVADDAPAAAIEDERLSADEIDAPLGTRATFVQFSSAFCQPCRVTRVVLADVAASVPGVVHVEIDAEHHLDLVRRLGIMRTPTTLVLDAHGSVIKRAVGTPRKADVIAALAALGVSGNGELDGSGI